MRDERAAVTSRWQVYRNMVTRERHSEERLPGNALLPGTSQAGAESPGIGRSVAGRWCAGMPVKAGAVQAGPGRCRFRVSGTVLNVARYHLLQVPAAVPAFIHPSIPATGQ